MAQQNLYLAVQRLNVTNGQWNTLLAAMQAKGENASPHPNNRCHWRRSLDSTIYIFEARFDSTVVDVDWFVNWMAGVFGIDPAQVTPTDGFNSYGRFTTFAYNAQNRIRIGVFGFIQGQGWPSWNESLPAAVQYIQDNAGDWDVEL